VNKAL
jgi:signal peptidase I